MQSQNEKIRRIIEREQFPNDFAAGIDTEIFLNDKRIDLITNIEYTVNENILPVFNYNSLVLNATAVGQRIVQGRFSVTYSGTNYIKGFLENIVATPYTDVIQINTPPQLNPTDSIAPTQITDAIPALDLDNLTNGFVITDPYDYRFRGIYYWSGTYETFVSGMTHDQALNYISIGYSSGIIKEANFLSWEDGYNSVRRGHDRMWDPQQYSSLPTDLQSYTVITEDQIKSACGLTTSQSTTTQTEGIADPLVASVNQNKGRLQLDNSETNFTIDSVKDLTDSDIENLKNQVLAGMSPQLPYDLNDNTRKSLFNTSHGLPSGFTLKIAYRHAQDHVYFKVLENVTILNLAEQIMLNETACMETYSFFAGDFHEEVVSNIDYEGMIS